MSWLRKNIIITAAPVTRLHVRADDLTASFKWQIINYSLKMYPPLSVAISLLWCHLMKSPGKSISPPSAFPRQPIKTQRCRRGSLGKPPILYSSGVKTWHITNDAIRKNTVTCTNECGEAHSFPRGGHSAINHVSKGQKDQSLPLM